MLGPERQHQPELFLYDFHLEERIPADHPLRRVLEHVDFQFVRRLVAGFYGAKGHVSEDPVLLLKLMFLLFFDNVSSERELMRQVGYRMDYLWFLGLGVQEKIPHHSVLSKARRRWGKDVFEAAFVEVVRQCVELGLVSGTKIHLDGSLIRANASMESVLRGGPELVEQLKAIYREQERKLEAVEEAGPKNYYQKQNARLVSRTDPEAAIVKQNRNSSAQLRYKHHRVVDDQCGVVTAMVTTPGDVEENRELIGLTRRHEKNTGAQVETVVADCQYGTQDNLGWCGKVGIESHLGEFPQGEAAGIFRLKDFRWDGEQDCYWCPAGQALTRQAERKKKHRKIRFYRAKTATCRACPMYGQCTRNQKGVRKIPRHVLQDEIERARQQSRSVAGRRDRVRRRSLMEGSFADAANNHHFKRARWRGLKRQRIQDYLIGICQNIRLILRHADRAPVLSGERSGRPESALRAGKVLYHELSRLVLWLNGRLRPALT